MANAMLEDVEFKASSSRPDLIVCDMRDTTNNNDDINNRIDDDEEDEDEDNVQRTHLPESGTGGRPSILQGRLSSSSIASSSSPTRYLGRKKSVDFTLDPASSPFMTTAMQSSSSCPSPKRIRQTDPWTAKQVVDGMFSRREQRECVCCYNGWNTKRVLVLDRRFDTSVADRLLTVLAWEVCHSHFFFLTCALAISTCISQHERLEAIDKARDTFDHDIQSVHDDEMSTGADAVLAKHLTFLVYHHEQLLRQQKKGQGGDEELDRNRDISSSPEYLALLEIGKTCTVMECLYRASSEIVGASFRRMGEHVVSILVKLIDQETSRRFQGRLRQQESQTLADKNNNPSTADSGNSAKNDGRKDMSDEDKDQLVSTNSQQQMQQSNEHRNNSSLDYSECGQTKNDHFDEEAGHSMNFVGDVILKKSTKLLGHFARVGEATKTLAHFPGLLASFIRLITGMPYASLPWEARLSALWTLANLACNHENMQMMVCIPGLTDALVEIACRPLHPGDPLEHIMEVLRSRAIACRAVLNLSWAPENKILLAEHTALIDLLAELAVHRSAPLLRSRTVREIVTTTRRHAVGALRNLAAAPRRTKLALCDYKNGHILDVLTDAALNDPDTYVKERSYAAIHNLAIQDTAERFVNHPALVLALRSVLLSDAPAASDPSTMGGGATTVSYEETCKTHASATLLVLERTITPDMESYESLRDLLEAINPTPASSASDNNDNSSDEMDVVQAAAV